MKRRGYSKSDNGTSKATYFFIYFRQSFNSIFVLELERESRINDIKLE